LRIRHVARRNADASAAQGSPNAKGHAMSHVIRPTDPDLNSSFRRWGTKLEKISPIGGKEIQGGCKKKNTENRRTTSLVGRRAFSIGSRLSSAILCFFFLALYYYLAPHVWHTNADANAGRFMANLFARPPTYPDSAGMMLMSCFFRSRYP